MERDGLLIFHSIHRVMAAERALKAAALDVRLLPVPRELSSDCGLSLAFAAAQWDAVRTELESHGLPPEEVYRLEAGRYRRQEEG